MPTDYLLRHGEGDSNLATQIAAGRCRDEDWLVSAYRQILEAMADAHEEGVVHLNLRPETVLVDGDVVKVSDFGLGTDLGGDGADGLTPTSQRSGMEPYMAPEQFAAMEDAGPETDVFALGKILMAMLTERAPMVGQPDVSDLPAPFNSFVSRCCAGKAENRYRNASEALKAFDSMLSPVTTQRAAERLTELVEQWDGTPQGPNLEVLREIDELLRTNAEDETLFADEVPGLSEGIITQYISALPDEFARMLFVYDDHVGGGRSNDYCDVVTDFYERIFEFTDPALKHLMLRTLWKIGAAHHRYHVRTRLLIILSKYKDPDTVAIAARVIQNGSPKERKFYSEHAPRANLPKLLREML